MNTNIGKSLLTLIFCLCLFQASWAQTVLKGNVINQATGEKQVGASVTLVGTKITAMTDENGNFELKEVDLQGVLEVSAPGCQWQIVPIQGRDNIKISLIPQSAAGGMYDKNLLSASVAAKQSAVNNAITAVDEAMNIGLAGNVRNISHSGLDAGGSATFVRGLHGWNGSGQPLYVVDGVLWQNQEEYGSLYQGYFSNPLSLISPDDIESIEVMKNGTAIYGAKAANGVIRITTKRAHNMATEITVNLSGGVKSPFKAMPMMGAADYRIYATDVMAGMEDINSLADKFNFLNDDPNGAYYLSSHNNTDWQKEISKTAFIQNYGVSVRGGDDVALYSFSLGYARNEGNIKNTDFERLNVRFNSDISLTKQLTTKADISFAQISRNLFDDGISSASPLYLSYVKSPLYNPYQFDNKGNLFGELSDTDELGVGNPLAIIENADGKLKNYRFVANLQPKYQFTDEFSLSAIATLSWDKVKENSFLPDFGLPEVDLFNEQGDWYGEGANKVSSFMVRHSTLTLGGDADWEILRGTRHNLKANAGMRYYNDSFNSDFGMGYNTGSDNLRSLGVTNSSLRTDGGTNNSWRTLSWHAVADYNYLNRYFLSASATMESSSRFGSEADGCLDMFGIRWGLFPSVNAGWVMTNESWMKNVSAINYLRLYAGFEVTGNDNIPIGAPRTYFGSIAMAGLAHGLTLDNIGNNKLKHEVTTTKNIGFDLRLLGNRLSLGADFYYQNTTDMLVQKTLPEEFGKRAYWANDGELSNKGFDINAYARIIDNRNWKLGVGLTVGHYVNKVESLGSGQFITTVQNGNILTTEGQPLGVFYGYKTQGVFSTQAEAEQSQLGIIAENGQKINFGAGDVHFVDVDNNRVIDEKDRQIIGNPNPDLYGNFSLNLQYRQFSFGANFTYSLGNDAYNALRAELESGSNMNNQTTYMNNRWTADGQITDVPRAVYGDPMGNSAFSDRWIEDASFLKLRQISASYKLPKTPSWLQGAEVWVAANNVFTITKYLGTDPEFSYGSNPLYQGVDMGLMPSTRSYHLGIRLNL